MSIEVTDTVIKITGTQVLKAQEAAEADAAAATGAPDALTGAANAGATGAVVGDTQATQNTGWGAASEAEFDSMHVAIDANVVDIALILAQADKSTIDIAAQKVVLDAVIDDHAALLVTVNALLAKLRTHGLIAT